MSLKEYLVHEQCSWHPGTSLGSPCRRLVDRIPPSICPCSETQKCVSSVTSLANVVCLRRHSIDLVLLELGDEYKSFELGFCYHALGRPRLFLCTVASGLSELVLHMAALGLLFQYHRMYV